MTLCICTHANLHFPGRNLIICPGVTTSLPAPGRALCLFVLPSMQNQNKKKDPVLFVRRPAGREALLGGPGASPLSLTGVRQGMWIGMGLPYTFLSPPTQVCEELPAL